MGGEMTADNAVALLCWLIGLYALAEILVRFL